MKSKSMLDLLKEQIAEEQKGSGYQYKVQVDTALLKGLIHEHERMSNYITSTQGNYPIVRTTGAIRALIREQCNYARTLRTVLRILEKETKDGKYYDPISEGEINVIS